MFSRTALALGLALVIHNSSFAAPVDNNPVNNNVTSAQESQPAATAVEQPLNPSIVNNEADINTTPKPDDSISAQTSKALDNAEAMVDKLPENAPAGNKTATPPQDWTVEGLNNANWTGELGKGQFTTYAKAQVLLNRNLASPGVIDGVSGKNMLKAISAFQVMHALKVTGALDEPTWAALGGSQASDAFQSYTLTQQDIDGPYAASIPHDYAEQAKMKALSYTRVTEMLGERFHMDENFLKKLNPQATFKKAGETIVVANPREELGTPVSLIIAHKGAKHIYAFDADNKMIAAFPATIGSSDTPSPTGTYKVRAVAPNPWYGYNPKNFLQGNNKKPLNLPPGPNGPVGNMWIALSKPSFGIHGTPEPSLISKTASHGCIRLTNWDANTLAKQVKPGVTVRFAE